MTLPVLLWALAAAAPGDVLVLDLKPIGVDGAEVQVVDAIVGEAVAEAFATLPPAERPKVLTSSDLRTISSLAAEKSAVGCDDASCMAELAGALGARYVVFGSVGRLGAARLLQLQLYDTTRTTVIARESHEAESLSKAAVQGLVRRTLAPLVTPPGPSLAKTVTGLALLGAGGVGAGASLAAAAVLDGRLAKDSTATPQEKEQALFAGPWVLVAAGGFALVAVVGAVVWLWPVEEGA